MRLCRIGPPGREKPAVLSPDGLLHDVSASVPEFMAGFFAGSWHEVLRDAMRRAPARPLDAGDRFGVPIAGTSKIVGVGMNYREGVRRAGMTTPVEPLLFIKPATCLAAANDPIILPPGAEKLDWEVELAVVLGREAYRISEDEADAAILGYGVFNDLSERRWQNEQGGEWCKGKSADGFGPFGPWLVTADEIEDPGRLDIWLSLNGEPKQRSNTADMVFTVRFVIAYVSRFMRLLPGDVIIMGTPPGTGWREVPPRFLGPGDRLSLGIAGLGEQNTTVAAGD
jgi:2,4-diketo-3-deoxy-L-fuconate hydrolase